MRTRSPSRTSPASSCAAKRLRTRTTFRYIGCSRRRSTVTITVRGCFAETTTPTFVLRWKRRQPVTACVAAAPCDTVAAARLRVTVLRTAGRGAVAVAAARGAAAVVFFAAALFFAAVVFVAVDFAAVVFLSCFSGIRGSLSLRHHREGARDAAARGRQPAVVLQLARRQLEAEVEELLFRALQLVSELGVRQPPHVLQLHCRPLPGPLATRTSS